MFVVFTVSIFLPVFERLIKKSAEEFYNYVTVASSS